MPQGDDHNRVNKNAGHYRWNSCKRVRQKSNDAAEAPRAKLRKINTDRNPERQTDCRREPKQNHSSQYRIADATAFADRLWTLNQKPQVNRTEALHGDICENNQKDTNR